MIFQRYAKEGDLVVDPMCGSGTTIDVCKEENRKIIGYDIAPRRKDIIKNDASKMPLEDNSTDFVFIDSPYSDNIKYSNDSKCIGKLSCEKEDFFIALDTVAKEIHRILKPTKAMAWLIGDQCKQKKYVPVGFKLYEILIKYFDPVDLVCISRHNQTSNTPIWHERARMYNFYLRGFKYLLITKKVS